MSFVSPDLTRMVRDFSAGFLETPEPDKIPLGSSPDARNTFLARVQHDDEQRAILRKGPGSRLLNPTPINGNAKVQGLIEFRREGMAPELLAVCADTLSRWDGASTFNNFGSLIWTPGRVITSLAFKNNLIVMDGLAMARYDGTNTLQTVGFAAPGTAPTLAAVAGPGVTGTYEGYVVWYNLTRDHESSPGPTSAAVVFANQQRQWGRPAGPPSDVTHWRIYCRRTDTNEVNFFLTATVAIGTLTHTEAVIDAARRDPGPALNSNDPPPVFAAMAVWNGFGIGIRDNDSNIHISKQGDVESWHPKDVFPVEKGSGDALNSPRNFGTDILIRKPTKTWRLVGTRLPFTIQNVHSTFGSVSQLAGVEVDGRLYDWDANKGPYVTDTVSVWQPLADEKIRGQINQVNRSALRDIRCVHDAERNLVLWAVPTGVSTRKRTILPFNYRLGEWLPPITGLEYASFTTYTLPDGRLAVLAGDEWGRVYQLFDGDRQGVPPLTDHTRTVTSATSNTVTSTGAAFFTTGSGLAGMPVAVRAPSGAWQWRRVLSNTADTITLDTTNDAPWTTTPAAGWLVVVGGIEWYWYTPWIDFSDIDRVKRLNWFVLQAKSASGSHNITVKLRFNGDEAVGSALDMTFEVGTLSGVWGVSLWGQALWAFLAARGKKRRVMRAAVSVQFRFENFFPDQPIDVLAYGIEADTLPRRRIPSA